MNCLDVLLDKFRSSKYTNFVDFLNDFYNKELPEDRGVCESDKQLPQEKSDEQFLQILREINHSVG